MAKLGIDIGNYAVKTSTGIVFESKVTTVGEYGTNAPKLTLDGKTFFLGEGEEEINAKKFEKENYIPLLLGAICQSTEEDSVDLALGLPIKQYSQFKQTVIDKLQDKEFNITFGTTKRNIYINSVKVFPEGVTGYLYFGKDIQDKIGSRDVVIVDIGGKTTDIALIKENRATKPHSMDIGTINIYDVISKSIEKDERFQGEVTVDRDKVQDYINKGFYFKGEKQDISSNIGTSKKLFKQIYNELKLNYPISTEAVVVMGGGAKLLGNAFKQNIPGIIVMEDIGTHVFANANGYRKMMK